MELPLTERYRDMERTLNISKKSAPGSDEAKIRRKKRKKQRTGLIMLKSLRGESEFSGKRRS